MRYYVVSVQHNKEKGTENRSVPKAFDTELQARQAFHAQLGIDMGNEVLDWSVCMIFTDIGSVIASERWEAPEQGIVETPVEEAPEPTEAETSTEEVIVSEEVTV